jgi:hypothetical protein
MILNLQDLQGADYGEVNFARMQSSKTDDLFLACTLDGLTTILTYGRSYILAFLLYQCEIEFIRIQ